ncbi:MAG: hypothetical protein HQL75_17270 [Magnetococcales bacterium]|nr:hypothetical protein [Magnetococcales bacterium]
MFDFAFEKLDDDSGGMDSPFSGYGRLTVTINGEGIWYDPRAEGIVGIADYWDGLVDHLARCWCYMRREDPYPLHFNPESPLGFLEDAMAELREMNLSRNAFIEEEIKIFAFSDRHNLATGMPDLFLPPLFMLREGNDMRIVTEMKDVRVPFEQAMARLEALGTAIAQAIHPQSQRGGMILEAWDRRHFPSRVHEALPMLVGTSPPSIAGLVAGIG